MIGVDYIPVGHQILNLSRFCEVNFVCFHGSSEEMIDALGAV